MSRNPYDRHFSEASNQSNQPSRFHGLFDLRYDKQMRPRSLRLLGYTLILFGIVYAGRRIATDDPVAMLMYEQKLEEEKRLLRLQELGVLVNPSFDL